MQPFFNNPRIQYGPKRNRKSYVPGQFEMEPKAELIPLGQLYVNLYPITQATLVNLGYNISDQGYKALLRVLKGLIGKGKTFDATPKKVVVKCNPDKPIPGNLIDNIKDYLESFQKGSSNIRKAFTIGQYKPIRYDMNKFKSKIHKAELSINQVRNCFKGLQSKFICNDYLDYKARAIHGKTQFNNCLANYKAVSKWCAHCKTMGITTTEDFYHATFECPQVQYLLHRIKQVLGLTCNIQPDICIFSCPRPPDARKNDMAECMVVDIIWTITLKIILSARTEGKSLNESPALTELNKNLKCIVRNHPTTLISEVILAQNFINKISQELVS